MTTPRPTDRPRSLQWARNRIADLWALALLILGLGIAIHQHRRQRRHGPR